MSYFPSDYELPHYRELPFSWGDIARGVGSLAVGVAVATPYIQSSALTSEIDRQTPSGDFLSLFVGSLQNHAVESGAALLLFSAASVATSSLIKHRHAIAEAIENTKSQLHPFMHKPTPSTSSQPRRAMDKPV